MKKAFTFCLSLALFLAARCVSSYAQDSPVPFVFIPQWTSQAQFAGYYVALEKGFYLDEGLDVRIVNPSSSQTVFEQLRENEMDATTLQLVQAMELADSGIQLVNILQTSMNNALVIVSRRGKDPMKLRGAKVSCWRTGFSQIAECVAAEQNLDFEWIQTSDGLNLFIPGAVDASLGMTYNEYYKMLQTGLVSPEEGVYRFSEHGYNIQEDGVYVTREAYRKHPERAKAFARASRKGWEWAAAHPDEALDIVMAHVRRDRIATNRVLQRLMLEEVLRLQLSPETGRREFRLLPGMVKQASDLMYRNGMIRKEIKMEDLLP